MEALLLFRTLQLLRSLFALVLVVALPLGVWAFWIEPRSLVVRHDTVEVDGLTRPVRVLLVGDLQPAGPHETPARLNAMMDRFAAEEPDLVVWVGDFVSERRTRTSFTHPVDTTAAMGRLDPPLGQLAVLGNHDWYWNAGEMERLLEAQGIQVLRDERVWLGPEAGGLVVVGLEEPVTHRPRLKQALAGVPAEAPTVLLTHTPDVFPEVPDHVDLTFAGHTHCGQVTIPGFGRPVVPSHFGERFAEGWHGTPEHRLRVTCGIGTAIVPVRFGNPPEAVVLDLVPRRRGTVRDES